MRSVTVHTYNSAVETIVREKEKEAEKSHIPFMGVPADELRQALDNYFGEAWIVKKEETIKFTKADINAVASARFFKSTGRTLLLGLAVILLSLAVAVRYIPYMSALYYNIYYTICGAIALAFIYIYSRKQAKVRKTLWKQLGREETED